MKAVSVVLLVAAAVCCSEAAPYWPLAGAPLLYAGAPAAVGLHAPYVYSAPATVTNVEIPRPVITKTNLNVITDEDKISTTQIKPFVGYVHHPYLL